MASLLLAEDVVRMKECPDEETILSFGRGTLAAEAQPDIEAHLADCDECRVLVAAVARSSHVDPSEMDSASTRAPGFGSRFEAESPPSGEVAIPVRPGEEVAGKYRMDRVLGTDGAGVVVEARQTQTNQRVAVRFLSTGLAKEAAAKARFLREAKAAESIASEHAARVLDSGALDDGVPYLVTEFVDGTDLGAVAADRGSLPPLEAIAYVLQACEAIAEAHELGIVHRDLKPANLVLTQQTDGTPFVKVLDFGITKASDEGAGDATGTAAEVTPRYMSPEQVAAATEIDARTDIWSLGIVLYELVTGKPVWHADTTQALRSLITSAPAVPLRRRAPHAPPLLEEVVARCLAKSPDDRIQSVAELASALAPIAPEFARGSLGRLRAVARRSADPEVAEPEAAAAPPSVSPSASAPDRAAWSAASEPLRTGRSSAPATSSRAARRSKPLRSGKRLLVLLAVGGLVLVGVLLDRMTMNRSATGPSAAGSLPSSVSALVDARGTSVPSGQTSARRPDPAK